MSRAALVALRDTYRGRLASDDGPDTPRQAAVHASLRRGIEIIDALLDGEV